MIERTISVVSCGPAGCSVFSFEAHYLYATILVLIGLLIWRHFK